MKLKRPKLYVGLVSSAAILLVNGGVSTPIMAADLAGVQAPYVLNGDLKYSLQIVIKLLKGLGRLARWAKVVGPLAEALEALLRILEDGLQYPELEHRIDEIEHRLAEMQEQAAREKDEVALKAKALVEHLRRQLAALRPYETCKQGPGWYRRRSDNTCVNKALE